MKASELIKELEQYIKNNGNHDVVILKDHYYKVTGVDVFGNILEDCDSCRLYVEEVL